MLTTQTKQQGFTLLEILVTMALVAILTAFAVPHYHEYRQRAYDLRAQHDLYQVAAAEEVYYFDHERYLSCSNQSCSNLPGITRLSRGVELSITAADDGFSGSATHPLGSGRVYRWDSAAGGLLD